MIFKKVLAVVVVGFLTVAVKAMSVLDDLAMRGESDE
jgi:hypothetical protein